MAYCSSQNIKEVINNFEKACETLLAWFRNNSMKSNSEMKKKHGTYPVRVGNKEITNSKSFNSKILLGSKIDQGLNVNRHES